MINDKRPRQYAQEIMNMDTVEQRRDALKAVPKNLRGMVRLHVENAFRVRTVIGRGREIS